MEVQLTDFENAAFSVFIVLLTRAILSFGLDFYIPISKVDENMKRAHKRNAAREGKFFFKKNVFQKRGNPFMTNGHLNGASRSHSRNSSIVNLDRSLSPTGSSSVASGSRTGSRCASPEGLPRIEDEYEEMTINEIINGKPDSGFPGLLGLVYSYLNSLNVDVATRGQLAKYLDLVKHRADGRTTRHQGKYRYKAVFSLSCFSQLLCYNTGTLQTAATWIRQFVRSHPEYKHDSVVSQEINFDLIHAIDELERGVRQESDLLGEYMVPVLSAV